MTEVDVRDHTVAIDDCAHETHPARASEQRCQLEVALPHLAAMSGLVSVGLPAAPELLIEHYEEIVLVHVVEVGRFDCVADAGRIALRDGPGLPDLAVQHAGPTQEAVLGQSW